MYIGNLMLLVPNLPLVGLWARISLIPYKVMGPIILAVCIVGAYSPRNTMFDVWVALIFGIIGFIMKKKGWPLAPLILGFLLGDLFESSLRQSLAMSAGSLSIKDISYTAGPTALEYAVRQLFSAAGLNISEARAVMCKGASEAVLLASGGHVTIGAAALGTTLPAIRSDTITPN